jgi:hypothetical protein
MTSINNYNSNNFILGINPTKNINLKNEKNMSPSESLINHLKRLEIEGTNIINNNNNNNSISNKKSLFKKNLNSIVNELIYKLEKNVYTLNNQIKNFNLEKKEIINLNTKEINRLRDIIKKMYLLIITINKSIELKYNNRTTLLEKLRKTIESNKGFLKNIDEIMLNNIKNDDYMNLKKEKNNLKILNIIDNKYIQPKSVEQIDNKYTKQPISVEKNNNKYIQPTSVEKNNNKYIQPKSVEQTDNKYTQQPTSVEKNNNKYIQPTSVEKNNNKYIQHVSVEKNNNNKYIQPISVEKNNNKYIQHPLSVEKNNNKYIQQPISVENNNNKYIQQPISFEQINNEERLQNSRNSISELNIFYNRLKKENNLIRNSNNSFISRNEQNLNNEIENIQLNNLNNNSIRPINKEKRNKKKMDSMKNSQENTKRKLKEYFL